MRPAACLSLLLLTACTGDEPDPEPMAPDCLETVDVASCIPAYPAEYARLMSETLVPVCGVQGGACHGDAGAEGAGNGLVITSDLDATHDALLDGFVMPGDATCSPVSVRAHLPDDDSLLMPPGAKLEDGVLCALTQWIDAGAGR